jgi:tyrosinase
MRQDIRTFSKNPQNVDKLRRAVSTLQSRGFDDQTGWFNMAGIHGFPANDPNANKVPDAIRALYGQCHRDDYLFFLWHRAYVSAMERLMQAAIDDPTFRLPYWDWYSDPKLPEIFRSEFVDAQKTARNPLYVKDRNRRANNGDNVWTPLIETDFNESDFSNFQNNLDFTEHGEIHMAVGTHSNMGDPSTAARDPIFWLHHADIDRLLVVWLKRDLAAHRVPNTFPSWIANIYRFPTPNGGGVATPSVEDLALASVSALGYEYENTNGPELPSPTVPARPVTVQSTAGRAGVMGAGVEAFAVKKSILVGAGATVDLPVPSAAANKFMLLESKEPESLQAVNIVLSDVRVLSMPTGVLSYRVYLNLPKKAGHAENFRDYYLGNISLFALTGAEHEHQGEKKPTEIKFSATKNIEKITKETAEAPAQISVSVVPVLAPDTTPPAQPVLKIGEIRLEGAKQ